MNEIVVYEDDKENKNFFLLEEGKIVENYYETPELERMEGNIYAR